MVDKLTNFYEITINPQITTLYRTRVHTRSKTEFPDNITAYVSKDTVVSFDALDETSKEIPAEQNHIEWLVRTIVLNSLGKAKSIFDIDYKSGEFSVIDERLVQKEEFSILRRVSIRIFHAAGKLVLAVNPFTKLYNRLSLSKLLDSYGFSENTFIEYNRCLVFSETDDERKWLPGYIKDIKHKENSQRKVKVEVPGISPGRTVEVNSDRVIPFLNRATINGIVVKKQPNYDFYKQEKSFGELTSIQKIDLIKAVFEKHINTIFPIKKRNTYFQISKSPLNATLFDFYQLSSTDEPEYVIDRSDSEQIVNKRRLVGLSQVNLDSVPKNHKVVLFATNETIKMAENVVSQLNQGIKEGSYRVSLPHQFGILLDISDKFVVQNYEQFDREIDIFINSPEEKHQNALAILYLPLNSSIYYKVKAKLAYHGKVSQVISKEKYDIYGIWNLATNIYAKLGYKPWGITEKRDMPNADMIIGFAYSSLRQDKGIKRSIGYVNVFDKNGVWQYIKSSAGYLDFDKRLVAIPHMINSAIWGYLAKDNPLRVIDIHYSKRFSYEERKKTFNVIKELVPDIKEVNFISLDKTHPLQVFDMNTQSKNFIRGGILQYNANEFLLSIAGEDKLNVPAARIIKVRVWREPPDEEIDIRPIAYRILSMSKLNWRSAVRETAEPVTLKYADEVARLTNHFSFTEWNQVNTQLSNIPWFI